jgi:hypothetical protein
MMPRFPVNIPLWGIATMSPKGVTRFCSGMSYVPAGLIRIGCRSFETPGVGREATVHLCPVAP